MVINIYRTSPLGQRKRVSQGSIDFRCRECQYSLANDGKRCRSKALIQRCWDTAQNINEWHRQHECPFIHQGLICRCKDYPTIEEAFRGAGLHEGQFK